MKNNKISHAIPFGLKKEALLIRASQLLCEQNGWNKPETYEDALLISRFCARFLHKQPKRKTDANSD